MAAIGDSSRFITAEQAASLNSKPHGVVKIIGLKTKEDGGKRPTVCTTAARELLLHVIPPSPYFHPPGSFKTGTDAAHDTVWEALVTHRDVPPAPLVSFYRPRCSCSVLPTRQSIPALSSPGRIWYKCKPKLILETFPQRIGTCRTIINSMMYTVCFLSENSR